MKSAATQKSFVGACFLSAVTGYRFQQKDQSRYYNGILNRVKQAAEVCFLSDGLPSKVPNLASTGPVTITDAFDNTGKATDRAGFDLNRHRGKMNVAFVDGHVETVNIASGDLAKIYLVPPG